VILDSDEAAAYTGGQGTTWFGGTAHSISIISLID
jgi:hypothetical protein